MYSCFFLIVGSVREGKSLDGWAVVDAMRKKIQLIPTYILGPAPDFCM